MAAVAGPVAKRSPQDTVEAREPMRRITEATEKYGRGKAVQAKKIRDKKLRGNLKAVEDRYKTAALRAKDAEILLENKSGFLEPEAELERIYKPGQMEPGKMLELKSPRKVLDCNWENLVHIVRIIRETARIYSWLEGKAMSRRWTGEPGSWDVSYNLERRFAMRNGCQ